MAYELGILKSISVIIGANEIVVPVSSFSSKIASEVGKVYVARKRTPALLYASSVKFSGSFESVITQEIESVLNLINSSNGQALTEFSVNDGSQKFLNCKMASLKISASIGKPLTASFDFVSLDKNTGTSVNAPNVSVVFVPQDITLTGIADYDIESFDISISNSLKEIFGMKGRRTPKFISEGEQTIEIDIKYNENHLVDVSVDDLTSIANASIQITGTDGTKTLTIAFAELLASDTSKNIKLDDIVRFGLKYSAKTCSFNFS